MGNLTNIGQQKTPGRPTEVTFAADLGEPSDLQEILLIGHKDVTSGTEAVYVVGEMANAGDIVAGTAEANAKFGAGSELAKMVIAAINANAGQSSLPNIKYVPLASTDTDFGAGGAALTAAARVKVEFLVSPYDGNNQTLRDQLKASVLLMSGAQRVDNNQFGTMGVVFNRSVTDPTTLPSPDTLAIIPVWMPDAAPVLSIAEMAAAAAAVMAQQGVPFNPLDDITIQNVAAPVSSSDWITVGNGLESEAALAKGWTPLKVKANGEVAFVRSVTSRISADGSGSPIVESYYDVQDFQVLYFFRKTVWTRFSQPDFKQRKASSRTAQDILSEVIRLASLFEDQEMFQAVSELAKQFVVQRNVSDRSRFDVKVPVNVVPGLHVIATNIVAGTQFDLLTI